MPSPRLIVSVACAITALLAIACGSASAAYDLDAAVRAVYYSKVSYCELRGIQAWTAAACAKFPRFQNVTAFRDEGHDGQGFVGYNPAHNELVLAFRGTVNLDGWIVDGDFFQTPYEACEGCLVHEGLYWAYLRLSAKLLPALQRLVHQYPLADILVTGHSMGAGESGFAFPDVVRKITGSKGRKRLQNFGSPRLGNDKFSKWLDTVIEPQHEHFRNTNLGDPIVHLPPISITKDLGLGQWIHSPREVFRGPPHGGAFANPKYFKVCKGNATHEDPTCADSTPIWDLSMRYHTTYLNIGLGCFLLGGHL